MMVKRRARALTHRRGLSVLCAVVFVGLHGFVSGSAARAGISTGSLSEGWESAWGSR